MRPHTVQDVQYDLSLLYEYETEGTSQYALAEREGMSQGHLSRRLARARRWKAEQRFAEMKAAAADRREFDRFDHTLMVLSEDQSDAGGRPWASPEGQSDRDRGTYHVGGQVRSLRGGTITTEDSTRTDGTAQPTSYQPDPSGLKGGVG